MLSWSRRTPVRWHGSLSAANTATDGREIHEMKPVYGESEFAAIGAEWSALVGRAAEESAVPSPTRST